MTFLPIVQRELRIAARRRSTSRVRWWATVLGLGLMFFSLVVVSLSRGRSVGNPVFNLLTGYAFGLSLLAGVVLTADALTEEKRAGTLGLLFLTDLKGYDVVLGKFIAQSLNAFYCLLALLPVTALPLLVGGVEVGEFWRTALALLNVLFFSLATGVCISAFLSDSPRAMGNTLGLLLLIVAGLPILRELGLGLKLPSFWFGLSWVSPFYPYSYAAELLYARHASTYWLSLGASQLLGWLFLLIASLVLPRKIQESRAVLARAPKQGRMPLLVRRARVRDQVRVGNPIQWLRKSELGFQWGAWLLAFSWAALVIFLSLVSGRELVMLGEVVRPFAFLLKVLFALQACRFLAEARRNGTLELLLCTPLSDREIMRGQLRALWLAFAWPVGVFVGAGLFLPAMVQFLAAALTGRSESLPYALWGGLWSAGHSLRLAADLLAISWFGMGLALTSERPNLAPALTILFVLVLPAPFSFCWVDVPIDLIFILWGVSKCNQNLRQLVAEQYQVVSQSSEQVCSPADRAPPVIG